MSTLAHQSLANGATTAQSKYGRLGGGTAINVAAPLGSVNAILFGYPGEGKSSLYQSHSDAFIFNLDESRIVTSDCQATIWPFINERGQVIGDNNTPVVTTWEMVENKIKVLQDLALKNESRPQTVVFDSVSSMIRLLMPYIIKKGGKTAWRDLHGQTAWDELYNTIVTTMTSLRSYGYGVHYVIHLKQVKIPQGDNNVVIRPEPQVSDALWHRIYPIVEFSGHLLSETDLVPVVEEQTITLRGQTTVEKRTVNKPVRVRYLSVTTRELLPYLKSRTFRPLPDRIPLPATGTWTALDRVYREADSQPK